MQWNGYKQTREFELPGYADGHPVFDDLPDGRLISSDGVSLYLETAPKSAEFERIRTGLSGYCSFIRVNKNGRIAWCDGVEVQIFSLNKMNCISSAPVAGYDGEWLDETRLAITIPGAVMIVDEPTLEVVPIITNVTGASGGVTFDKTGTLFTGTGSDGVGPSTTGTLKCFKEDAVHTAFNSRVAIDFEVAGQEIAELLSAAYLGFDIHGNLHISGGDPKGSDYGFGALVSAAGVQTAMAGGDKIDESSSDQIVHRFDPDDAPGNFYFVNSNHKTGELYFSDFNAKRVFVYAQ